MKRAIVRQVTVAATVDECWRALTQKELVALWFADVKGSLLPGGHFEFHFGDGDFFTGSVDILESPLRFQFHWQFMGTGGVSEIAFHLFPLKEETEISVIDLGDYSEQGALELREGWDDFLSRFKRSVTLGVNARYRWSESIGTGTVLPLTPAEAAKLLSGRDLWNASFKGSPVKVTATGCKLKAVFRNDLWNGRQTTAHITIRATENGAAVSVVHKGWNKLAEAIQFTERKRYAGYWADFFRAIHRRFGDETTGMAAQDAAGGASATLVPKSLAG